MKTIKNIMRILFGLSFIGASTFHFITDAELKIIPPFLPWRRAALYISGVFEVLGGIGLLIPRFKRSAAWGLAALLVAIFPANVYHALKNVQVGGFMNTRLYHVIRLPLQGVLIWWILWSASDTDEKKK